MDVRQIRDFVAVVRCTSFAAASRNLRMSQPGLGYQVKQLESELQVRLLQRHARGVSLTQAGETFMEHAELILAAIDSAKHAMAMVAGDDRREIRIGLTPSLQTLAAVLLTFAHPDGKRIRLREASGAELHQGLIDGSLDIAICLNMGRAPLRTRRIYSESLYAIGPNTAFPTSRKKISVRDLSALPLVLGCRARTSRRLLEEAAGAVDIKLTVDEEVESQALLRSLVLHSGRYTVAPYGIFAEEIETGLLSAARIVDPEIHQSVNAVYAGDLPASLDKFIAMLIEMILTKAPLPLDAANLASIAAE
jgi:LysR family nitrogen assimilation transcriptional regulator